MPLSGVLLANGGLQWIFCVQVLVCYMCVCVFAICLRLLSLTKTNIKKKELTLFSFFFITYIWDIFKEHVSFLCSSLHNWVTYWFRRPSRDPGEADLLSRKIACRSTVLEHDSILCTVHHSELASTKCFPPLQRGLFIFHVKWCKLCTYFPCCCIMALTLIYFFLQHLFLLHLSRCLLFGPH